LFVFLHSSAKTQAILSNRHKNVKTIEIKGARMHNLKNINLDIPRHQLTVVTGVSGSGKSSLVFDTLYAEGQRRYVESLSAYARQFLGRLDKPEVDYIRGLTPAIALEQKVNTRNPRSTVATTTELYDYLKLLFARCGHTISPISGKEVKAHQVKDVVADFEALSNDSHFYVLLQAPKKYIHEWMESNLRKGFSRCFVNGRFKKIEQWLEEGNISASPVYLLIDRIIKSEEDEEQISRLADSVQSAFWEGKGEMTAYIEHGSEKEYRNYSNRFEADGMEFERPSVDFLSFNNPYGACKKCEGFGSVIGIDPDLVIPDKQLSLYEGCVAPWRGETLKAWMHEFIAAASEEFPIHKPYAQLSAKQKTLLWKGSRTVSGIDDFFNYLEEKSYKIQYRVMLAKYRGKTTCDECHGTRLRRDAGYVKLIHQNEHHQPLRSAERFACLSDVLLMTIEEARVFFRKLKLSDHEMEIADRMLKEINSRLEFLHLVGVGYLSLNRLSNSLSGGESQRINLATSLGSSLVGSTYVLDEPSIGLHSKDTLRLMEVLKQLRDIGNTVIVVEHDEDVMRTSDHMIDIGPLAGKLGGELVFSGTLSEMLKKETLTASYLNGQKQVAIPEKRRKWTNRISLKGNRLHNLKNFDVDIPLNTLTVVSGVSGSGKTSLIKGILYPAVLKYLGSYTAIKTGDFDGIAGDLKHIQQVEMVDQNPIGKSSRSNPVTYLKAYDAIRDLYAAQSLSKSRGFTSGHFSFNVDGGRCDHCQGEGTVTVEMQFMADIHLKCEVCQGRRFKEEVLEVHYKGKSVFDVLEMTVDEAMDFFTDQNTIVNRLKPLQDVGLGYISLGQSSNTLSGGEAQRVKLAYFLSKGSGKDKVLFIFDEPTTGLHFHDINKLLTSFNALIKQGHSIVVIEHNMDVIKAADWIIDLGPGGGPEGGTLLFAGLPEDLVQNKNSHTATFLRDKLPIN
jgi:excinuclease ABC subunit A